MNVSTILNRTPDGLTTLPPSAGLAIIAVVGSVALPCMYVGRNDGLVNPASSISKIRLCADALSG
jgi:hypothetical protein